VAYNRRQPRRQGVRYGPPREKPRYSESGVLIGRFLGLGILLLVLGVLAAGALAFMGDRPAAPSTSSRTITPSATTRPATTPTALPSANPPISPPATTPTVPTPGATSVPPLVQIGEGYVTFGTRDDDQLHILDPRSVFAMDERIVWSAFLTERADSAELRIHILKIDPAVVGGERLIVDEEVTPLVINAQIFSRRLRPQALLDGPGVYVVRYLRGTDLLSEGYLEITAS